MGRRLVISDIHGCSKTLNALLKKINLNEKDTLYFLGDYIDRGPDSSGVLDTLIKLKKKYANIFPLAGNHEYQMLQAEKEYDENSFYFFVKNLAKSKDILNKKKKNQKKIPKIYEVTTLFY